MRSLRPRDIVRQIKSRRISVLVSVPKILDVLREHVAREFPHAARAAIPRPMHWSKRWWRYRQVHRAFGWKFWAAVVGAAPLDPGARGVLGTPRVPRRPGLRPDRDGAHRHAEPPAQDAPRHRSASRSHGVEVKIAEDGEILVRGDNVTKGYFGAPEATRRGASPDGWLHTGDIGGTDEQGRIYIKGRKKEMIVTPEGLNVFPEDVERALTRNRRRHGTRRSSAGPGTARSASTRWSSLDDPAIDLDAVVQRRQRDAGRSPEDPQRLALAGRRAAAHRGHAQAETARGEALGRRRATRRRPPASGAIAAPPPSSPRCSASPRARRRRPRHDDRGAGPQLARAGRVADGARGARPDDDRRGGVRRGATVGDLASAGGRRRGRRSRRRRRTGVPASADGAPAEAAGGDRGGRARSPSPPGTGAGRSRGCGTPACRPGSCRSAAPSPG